MVRCVLARSEAHKEQLGPHEWWLPQLAEALSITVGKLANWARRRWARSRRTPERHLWILWADEPGLARLRRLAASPHRGVVKYPAELTTPKRLGHGSRIGSGQTGVPPSPRINYRPSDGDAEEDERGGFGDRRREHSELQGVEVRADGRRARMAPAPRGGRAAARSVLKTLGPSIGPVPHVLLRDTDGGPEPPLLRPNQGEARVRHCATGSTARSPEAAWARCSRPTTRTSAATWP